MSPNLRRVLVGNKFDTSKGLLSNIALLYRILNGRVVQALKLVAPNSWVDSESAKIGDPLSGDVDVAEINIDLHSKILAQVLAQGFMDAQINGAFGFSSSNFNCLTNPKKFQNGSHHFNRVILSQIKSSTLPREDPDLVVLEDDHGYIALTDNLTPDGVIADSHNVNLEGNELLNLSLPESFSPEQSAQPSQSLASFPDVTSNVARLYTPSEDMRREQENSVRYHIALT
ncbi:hypothetical protein BDV23DRAFT_181679 [Aspergillus alliaceus]|uniref:Uncharacterized protein n=1 Tax=Petromyces alliaceus TaxID=209559 RepID=A0A5N7CEA4_PETAA|nr:hypothetical protein BDV23DRAFT_181679 [Aspergillus alliaceus]